MSAPAAAIGSIVAALVLGACAFDLAHVDQVPVSIRPTAPAIRAFVLERDTAISLPWGYRRVLKQGSTWRLFGAIDAGEVYSTRDQVLTVEVSNIHEAYIVVKDSRLVGFYLPVERTFSRMQDPVVLPIRPVQ